MRYFPGKGMPHLWSYYQYPIFHNDKKQIKIRVDIHDISCSDKRIEYLKIPSAERNHKNMAAKNIHNLLRIMRLNKGNGGFIVISDRLSQEPPGNAPG